MSDTATWHPVKLVGAGPGDAELLTRQACRALRWATVVLVDDLVHPSVLRWVRRSARIVPVGKRGGCVSTPQAFIHRLMVAEARKGERVVRLKGGDPFVFGRGGEEADALRQAGLAVEVISGLTSGIAAPAAAGIPVTDRRFAPGVAFVTGHAQEGGTGPDWAALARSGLTLVIYMGLQRVAQIQQALMDGGLAASTPAAIVRNGARADARVWRCSLGGLTACVQQEQVCSPALLMIGEVTALVASSSTDFGSIPLVDQSQAMA